MTARFQVRAGAGASVDEAPPTRDALEFHRRLPGYRRTPLLDRPVLAEALGVGQVLVKDEASRLGLPAFKILGASWASYRAVLERLGREPGPWSTTEELADRLASLRPMALAAATDGNHGRAVARMAVFLGFEARIFVPAGTAKARIDAIESEGASCAVVDGTYDDAVARSAAEASERCLVISDTSWPGYEDVPRWVIEGYGTIFWEVDDELDARGAPGPDMVVVQMGVGALAAAVVRHYRRPGGPAGTRLLGVEPTRAACVLASAEAGRIVTVPGPHDSIMAGLNCGTPSLVAWPLVSRGIDVFCAVDDGRARQGMRTLARARIVAGETGAAGLGGLVEVLSNPAAEAARAALGLGPATRVLLLCTEGATDPAAYAEIVGVAPDAVTVADEPEESRSS
ncbi:MAG TPA: diaminopropionate ammonia-lyase [Actinomycetes bacterium]|nr:diaminopropionate ammonia-lyase [Actinomycetes bacterium]